MTAADLYSPFLGSEATIAAFLRRMLRHGVPAEQALAMYDDYMAEQMTDMIPAPAQQADPNETRQPAGQADREYRLGACPKCGGEVWGIKKCPHISPPWRTFLACDNETCGYHGRSRLTVEALRRRWPDGAEVD